MSRLPSSPPELLSFVSKLFCKVDLLYVAGTAEQSKSRIFKDLERQILMQNQMRERQMAMQIAWSREFLRYYGYFFAVTTLGLTAGAVKRKKPGMLLPIIPLGFVLAYQMDSAYGTMIYRMKEEAESIMASEQNRLDLPHGAPTFDSIEKARRAKSSLISFLEK